MDFLDAIGNAFSSNLSASQAYETAKSDVAAGYDMGKNAIGNASAAKQSMEDILAQAAALQQQHLSEVASADGANPNDAATYDLVQRTAQIHQHVAEANRIKGDMARVASLDPIKNPLEWLIGQVTSEFQQEAYKNHAQFVDDNLRQIGTMNDNLVKIANTNKLLDAANAKDMATLRNKEIAADAAGKVASLQVAAAKDGSLLEAQKAEVALSGARLASMAANEAREETRFGWAAAQEKRNVLQADLDYRYKEFVFGEAKKVAPFQYTEAETRSKIVTRQLADLVANEDGLIEAGRAVGLSNLTKPIYDKLDKDTKAQIAAAALNLGTPLDRYEAWSKLTTTSGLVTDPPAAINSMLRYSDTLMSQLNKEEAAASVNPMTKWDKERKSAEFNMRMKDFPLKEAAFISTAQILDASPMLRESPFTEALKAKAIASPTNTVSPKEFVDIAVTTLLKSGIIQRDNKDQQEVAVQHAGVLLAEYQKQAAALVQKRTDYTKFGIPAPNIFRVDGVSGSFNSFDPTESAVEVARVLVRKVADMDSVFLRKDMVIQPKNVRSIPQ